MHVLTPALIDRFHYYIFSVALSALLRWPRSSEMRLNVSCTQSYVPPCPSWQDRWDAEHCDAFASTTRGRKGSHNLLAWYSTQVRTSLFHHCENKRQSWLPGVPHCISVRDVRTKHIPFKSSCFNFASRPSVWTRLSLVCALASPSSSFLFLVCWIVL